MERFLNNQAKLSYFRDIPPTDLEKFKAKVLSQIEMEEPKVMKMKSTKFKIAMASVGVVSLAGVGTAMADPNVYNIFNVVTKATHLAAPVQFDKNKDNQMGPGIYEHYQAFGDSKPGEVKDFNGFNRELDAYVGAHVPKLDGLKTVNVSAEKVDATHSSVSTLAESAGGTVSVQGFLNVSGMPEFSGASLKDVTKNAVDLNGTQAMIARYDYGSYGNTVAAWRNGNWTFVVTSTLDEGQLKPILNQLNGDVGK